MNRRINRFQVVFWSTRIGVMIAMLGFGWSNDASAQSAVQTVDVESPIKSVTVFREQADVIREIQLEAAQGLRRIRVTNLPASLLDQNLRWESDGTVVVRSIEIRCKQKKQAAPRPELESRLTDLRKSVTEASNEIAVIEQDLQTIDELVDFASIKSTADLHQSKLDTASVSELADYVMQTRRTLAKELHGARLALQQAQRELDQATLNANKDKESEGELGFEATLTVDSPGGGSLRLGYWVDGVSWIPHYTVRATSGDATDRLEVQLIGELSQHSGEDWQDVKLTFCTGVPSLQATSPVLVPLRVSVQSELDAAAEFGWSNGTSHQNLSNAPSWLDPATWQRNLHLNSKATDKQVLEINQQQGVQRELADDAGANLAEETYSVDATVTIANRTDAQSIGIFQFDQTSKIYRVVTPLLSSFAYREAELKNHLPQSLVGGDATVFLDGRFVGKTNLPPTAAGGEFLVGLGTDRQVRSRRELLARDTTIKGGNRLSTLKYRLVISNYHDSATDVRLFDRLPISSDDDAIGVSSDDDGLGELSDDPRYLRMLRPTGILRWDLSVPAQRFGSKAFDHHFHYTVESDRTQSIVSGPDQQQLQQDLRFKHSGGGGMGGGMGGGGIFP